MITLNNESNHITWMLTEHNFYRFVSGKDFGQKIAMAEELKQSIPIKILRTTLELKY
ncbi:MULTISPECIES: hypothetical protein [Sphingobacterium]|uniref:Uncharacterized protein n=1 Tax=Sphingobacterium kitahiroshimense TaxID=470446 RepID=A0ABV0BYZ1_9SPHI|nr:MULTISPECIES: hypothetical protein [Sphingobacterium]KKX47412.1 hypothetical protein L950_0226675 [Sphingobacterium sp. IITKGP-BTPF85]MCW2260180.1 hypothetical protein [Sphingobacterium kitahiroshimense]NJI71913.1 hypothetical protein [Sphingobacterium sp. B16(2022)]TCR11030.1 hypothetical protein EDF67_104123 [Sphingobacterium sp. JUb78]